jgi:hypothetical protein
MNRIIPPQDMLRAEKAIRREVRRRYEDERKRVSLWGRFRIWMQVEREVRKEMEKKFPPGALYVRSTIE